MKKTFYRVSNILTNQGLWYDQNGEFTGLIHGKFDFCKNKELPMPYDSDIRGYLSTTDSLDTLYQWFPIVDILRLQEHDYYIHEYITDDYKEYQNHWVINQNSSIIVAKHITGVKMNRITL